MRRTLFSPLGPILSALVWLSGGDAQSAEAAGNPRAVAAERDESSQEQPAEQREVQASKTPASPNRSSGDSDVPTFKASAAANERPGAFRKPSASQPPREVNTPGPETPSGEYSDAEPTSDEEQPSAQRHTREVKTPKAETPASPRPSGPEAEAPVSPKPSGERSEVPTLKDTEQPSAEKHSPEVKTPEAEAPPSPKPGEGSDESTLENADVPTADVTTRATVRVPLVGDDARDSDDSGPDSKRDPGEKLPSAEKERASGAKKPRAKKSRAKKSRAKKSRAKNSRAKKSRSKKSRSKKSRSKKRGKRSSSEAKKSKRRSGKSNSGKKRKTPGHPDCDYRTPIYEHKVAEGEHVGSIAGRYGVRRADIIKLNSALQKNPNLIHPGQTLRVCPDIAPRVRVEKQHTVAKGESLGKIAGHYGLTVRELVGLQAGKLRTQLEKNPNSLWVGTKLRILVEKQVLEVYKPPAEDVGRLPVGVKLKPRSGVLIKRDHLVWGTKATIRALEKAIKTYYRRKPGGPKVRVGDISKKGGGALRGHLSHQRGVDVDIGIVHKGSKRNAERFTHATSENFDVARTWALLKAIIDTQAVRVVFLDYALQKRLYQYARKQGVSENTLDELLQYPRGRGRAFGIVRHWRSHRGHLHVRFRR